MICSRGPKDPAVKKRRGHVDRSETFREFLAKDGVLAEAEDAALREIIADQIKVAMKAEGLTKTAIAGGIGVAYFERSARLSATMRF
jgi:hypothetical protein